MRVVLIFCSGVSLHINITTNSKVSSTNTKFCHLFLIYWLSLSMNIKIQENVKVENLELVILKKISYYKNK